MTEPLFRDAYLRKATGTVIAVTEEGGLVLDRTIFYPTSGGQPGDCGRVTWADGVLDVVATVKGDADTIVLVGAQGAQLPAVGSVVDQQLNWENRFGYMRVHTALHLLSVVIPLPVTGGAVSQSKGRLDFDMVEPPSDKGALSIELNHLISRDLAVSASWISEAALDANPGLVKTLSVQPPRGTGRIRLVRIGDDVDQVDLQPCGGTHVAHTGEIGQVRIGKIEKKGAQNRRVYVHLVEDA